jgi:hypothetical protein
MTKGTENEEHHSLKPDPEAIKAAATREQIAPAPQNKRSFRSRSKSVSSMVWSRQTSKLSAAFDVSPLFNYAPVVPVKVRSWEPTLEQAIKAIVSIKANHVRSFDTETSGIYQLSAWGWLRCCSSLTRSICSLFNSVLTTISRRK